MKNWFEFYTHIFFFYLTYVRVVVHLQKYNKRRLLEYKKNNKIHSEM